MSAVQHHEDGRNDAIARAREAMVVEQIQRRGVSDPRVLEAMRRVPRHRFVPQEAIADAYSDHPLPIGHGQTISQPYMVAVMIEALQLPDHGRVLEIGTGCGYEAAVLAEAGFAVFTTEIVPELARAADELLRRLGYAHVQVRCGDGALGWPEAAPFDGIVAAAAPQNVPAALFEQLAPEGRLVIPLGGEVQNLWRYRRTAGGFAGEELFGVRFVPMTGDAR